MNDFKNTKPFDDRKKESLHIIKKYSERIPIIVQKDKKCNFNEIDKSKYLVPKDMKMGQFIYIIRKRIILEPSQTLFIMINNRMVTSSDIMSNVYDCNADEDGFLYITYSSENTFG